VFVELEDLSPLIARQHAPRGAPASAASPAPGPEPAAEERGA
jgi:hypothetical protein